MYPPQYYNLPPVDPSAFGGLPQEGGPQGWPPPPQPQGGPQGQPPMDMDQYLIDKVMEVKRRMGGGEPGALSAITEAMMSQQTPQPPMQQPPPPQPPMQQPPMQQPPMQQPPMRA